MLPRYQGSSTSNLQKSAFNPTRCCFRIRMERCLSRVVRWLVLIMLTSILMSIFGLCNLPRDTINRLYGNQNGELIPRNDVHPDFTSDIPVIPKLPETVQSVVREPNQFSQDQNDGPRLHPEPEKVHKSPVIKAPIINSPLNTQNVDNPVNDISFKDYAAAQAKSLNDASKILVPANDIKEAQDEILNKDTAKRAYLCNEKDYEHEPYDVTRGTPEDTDIIMKRDFVKGMVKHAWDGYVKYAWMDNELRPVSHKGHSQSIFGNAKSGATIIDAMDTMYLMGMKEEYEKGRQWVMNEFKFNSKSEVSVFETNIRFIGGLLSLYYLTGEKVYRDKAQEITDILMPAFETPTGLPYALFNPSTKKMKNYPWASAGCSILSEFGTLHLEFGSLSHLTKEPKYLDAVLKVRNFLKNMKRPDSGVWYNFINPKTGQFGTTKAASVGALGDSFYEYLIKTYVMTDKTDETAMEMYVDSLRGIKNDILRQAPGGLWYLGELKRTRLEPKMGHLTCFAGGMFALGSKHMKSQKDKDYWMDMAKNIGETCHESYKKSPTGIGPESFRFDNEQTAAISTRKNEKYYILRPEVIETYFYLWRFTKDPKWRAYGWEAAQAIDKHCRTDAGYSGLKDVYQVPPVKDDLQQSFVFAETFKYLYLLFSDDDLLSLDEWVFNTEAHPLKIIKGC